MVGISSQPAAFRPKARTHECPSAISSRHCCAAIRPVLPIPATELMKMVATKAPQEQKIKKVFDKGEIAEILAKRDAGEGLTAAEHVAIREEYRHMKRRVKELEKGI